jgi:hypothetical protein
MLIKIVFMKQTTRKRVTKMPKRRTGLLTKEQANQYISRSVREAFAATAAKQAGRTYNFNFSVSSDEDFEELKTAVTKAFTDAHILHHNQFSFTYDPESHSGKMVTCIAGGKYTAQELQEKIVNPAYKMADPK